MAEDVTDCIDDRDEIDVQLVDYAVMETVTRGQLFYLEKQFCLEPAFAANLAFRKCRFSISATVSTYYRFDLM